jgi:hypothetical protein
MLINWAVSRLVTDNSLITVIMAIPWLRQSVSGLSPQRSTFNPVSQSTSNLWWTKWVWDRFFSEYFGFPISIISPMLHTHSFIHHQHCIMFFSQYFSFPLSVSFHHCSILIHSSAVLFNVTNLSVSLNETLEVRYKMTKHKNVMLGC